MSKTKRGSAAPPPPVGPLLRLRPISEQYGISVDRLRAAIDTKKLRAYKLGDARNSHWGVTQADLDEFLASRASGGAV